MIGCVSRLQAAVTALFLAAGAVTGISPAQATVLTFEDISPRNPDESIPNGYKGLAWNNFDSFDPVATGVPVSGYQPGTTSGKFVAFNDHGNQASISAASPFHFVGGNFTAAWRNGLELTITGLRNGQVEHTATLTLQTTSYRAVQLDWKDVDALVFSAIGGVNPSLGGDGTHFVMDDLNIAGRVPIPCSLVLLLTGCGALTALGAQRHWRVTPEKQLKPLRQPDREP
jgi:hypothetical protein